MRSSNMRDLVVMDGDKLAGVICQLDLYLIQSLTDADPQSAVVEEAMTAQPYVVAPDAALGEPLLHVCLFERWGRSYTLRFGLALLLGRLPRTAGYRVVAGRDVRISVLSDAGEAGRQPVQIDGDDALTLPVSIGLAAGAVRLLRPAS